MIDAIQAIGGAVAALSNKTINDALFIFMCLVYLRLTVGFLASLTPHPKRKRRKGTWTQDDARGK